MPRILSGVQPTGNLHLGNYVGDFLAPVRERYTELRGDPARLTAILEQGAAKAQAIARENLAPAKERMGFLPRAGG